MSTVKKVIIVGGGFAGLSLIKQLVGQPNIQVTLIDRRNYHLFQPLLYQVAMAGLNPSEISVSFRALFSKYSNFEFLLSEVEDIDLAAKKIKCDDRWLGFDYLAIACGSKHFYFGHDDWEPIAPGLKSIEQATEIRRRVLLAFEFAEKEADPIKRARLLTFVVIGGGPTGVELAGAIAEMCQKTIYNQYKHADLKKARVVLVEAAGSILQAFPPELSAKAQKDLEDLGVEVRLNQSANDLSTQGLLVGTEFLPAQTIIWAAGVKPSQLSEKIPYPKTRDGRIIVNQDLSIPDHSNVFILGDQAAFSQNPDTYLPTLAPVAIQEGRFVGNLIKNELKGKPRPAFRYFDKGIMATIGLSKAVVSSGPFKISGKLAWLAWVFVHILYLVRFRNKFLILIQWAWSYCKFGKTAPLIVHKTWRFYDGTKIPIRNEAENPPIS